MPGHAQERRPDRDSAPSVAENVDWAKPHANDRPVLDDREQAVMDHILAAMQGIQDLGLRTNTAELAQAVHVLQSFVIQHMLQRLAPGQWGKWFDEEVPDASMGA